MNDKQIELNKLAQGILDLCAGFNWDIDEKNESSGIKYICHTAVGRIRMTRWHHNGEFNINFFDSVTKIKKLQAYANGYKDGRKL